MTEPRYLQLAPADPSGLRPREAVPWTLPYHLQTNDILRVVEDVHELLHNINGLLANQGYERLEELLDPAGFSGLLSRAVVDRIGRLSRSLVPNEYHNGYPDLLPRDAYPQNQVQHGERGGLEVKASRTQAGWQAHGPRAGWFLVVQFDLDEDESKALRDREPTRVLAVMVAELEKSDWNWQPARPNRIRSGTASVKPSGQAKLRAGAIWVEPTYEVTHQELLADARRTVFRATREQAVLQALEAHDGTATLDLLVSDLVVVVGISDGKMKGQVTAAVRSLEKSGTIRRNRRGKLIEISVC